jgi:NAD(P)H-flavin reductase
VYDAEFRSLARRYPSFTYLPALREPPAGWRGEKGEPAEVVDRLVHNVDRLIVYVCGGGETIDRVRQALVAKGMERRSVKWEKFW